MKSLNLRLLLIITFSYCHSIAASQPDDSDWIFVGHNIKASTHGTQSVIAAGTKDDSEKGAQLALKQKKLSNKRNPFAHAPQGAKDKMREALLAAKKKQSEGQDSQKK